MSIKEIAIPRANSLLSLLEQLEKELALDLEKLSVLSEQSVPSNRFQIPDDPVWNHNVSILYSHCGDILELKGEYLFVKIPIIQTTARSIFNNIKNYFYSSLEIKKTRTQSFLSNLVGLDFTPNATLFDPREKLVRECAVKVLNKGVQLLAGGTNDSIIGYLDLNPAAYKIPNELRQLLETLFLYGITPYTYKSLQSTEFESDALPEDLRLNLFKIKDKLSNLEWSDQKDSLFQSTYGGEKAARSGRKKWRDHVKFTVKYNEKSSLHQSFIIFKELYKILESFIDNDSTRSLISNPACREITRDKFTRQLGNLFSWNGISMKTTFPEFYEAYKKLQMPLETERR